MSAQFPEEQSESGEFERQPDEFRDWITADGSSGYPAVAGRYHLFISLACPWASRTYITRQLKGLDHAISLTILDPMRDEKGWHTEGNEEDPITGFRFLSEAYRATNPNFRGRVTVPALWDKQTKRIVNNCEDDICRMFNDAFAALAKEEPDLFPEDIAQEQEKLSQFVYENINNGVYRAGFASRQRPYEKACRQVFEALDQLETRLSSGRYLFGRRIVETDWRLFCTLVRFDPVYHGHFKCNLQRIVDYRNLQRYLLDLYQVPGVAETVNLDHIKRHYYNTHRDINPTGIVPLGPSLDLSQPHGRDKFIKLTVGRPGRD